MPRWLTALLLAGAIFLPSPVHSQAPIALSNLQVQLWPEYDQPSMLVIYDFQVGEGTELPVSVSIPFPADANLVAVAVHGADGSLLNADYLESAGDENWQSVVVQIQSATTYRLEYYQPLSKAGVVREFSYQWRGDYAVGQFGLSVRMPTDATDVSADPALVSTQNAQGTTFLGQDFGSLPAGQPFNLALRYARASDALAAPQGGLEPSEPLDGGTAGRVMLSNYLPYVLGGLGVVLVVGGALYFLQSGRAGTTRDRRRSHAPARAATSAGDVYCPQCGTRAEAGDRFCRVCGTRLRPPD